MNKIDLNPLAKLLRQRLSVIADHELRERDPAAQLAELQRVSEALVDEQRRLQPGLPPRLAHFLTQASYNKALDWIEEQSEAGEATRK